MRTFGMVVVLVLLSALGGWLLGRDGKAEARALIERQDSTIERLSVERSRALARADSLESETRVLVDTAEVYITRWRTRTDTLTVTQVVALADSTIDACQNALTSCQATIEAKDSALVASERRAEALEAYREELADRLMKVERAKKWRSIRDMLVGGGIAYTVCAVTQ